MKLIYTKENGEYINAASYTLQTHNVHPPNKNANFSLIYYFFPFTLISMNQLVVRVASGGFFSWVVRLSFCNMICWITHLF